MNYVNIICRLTITSFIINVSIILWQIKSFHNLRSFSFSTVSKPIQFIYFVLYENPDVDKWTRVYYSTDRTQPNQAKPTIKLAVPTQPNLPNIGQTAVQS